MNHLRWCDDSMIIFFHKYKTNQDGLEKNFPWHNNVNPMLLECCLAHNMVVYFFTISHIKNNDSRIFPEEHQYRCYSYLLKKFIEDNKEDLANYTILEKLGSHSIRKEEAYYFYSGSHPTPLNCVHLLACRMDYFIYQRALPEI